jgi:hypothetical protein
VIHEARTDITGRFKFIGLPAGEITFVATHRFGDGWQTSNRVKRQAGNGEVRLSMIGAPENFCNCACPIEPRPYDFGYCQYCQSCGG